MYQRLKFVIMTLLVIGTSYFTSGAYAGPLSYQPVPKQVNCAPTLPLLLCANNPDACKSQSCGDITVNTLSHTCGCLAGTGYCGLDGAIILANSCPSPTTIKFDPSIIGQTINVASEFTLPLHITGNGVTLEGQNTASDGTIQQMTLEGADKNAFFIKGSDNEIKNFLFRSFSTSPIHIDATATNADVRNVRTYESGVAILQSEATDSSETNVPVMVAQSGNANEYVIFAIVPTDSADSSNLRFCQTTSQTSNDCLSTEKVVTNFKTHALVDPAGNFTDGSKIMLEITVSGSDFELGKNYMALVKNNGKSVAIANLKAGLSPFFTDSDGDFLRDIDETIYFLTNTGVVDTDGDTVSDFYNMMGLPGQSTVAANGVDVYPAANANGFLPGNYKLAATHPTQSETPSSSGCSLVKGSQSSRFVSPLMAIALIVSLILVRTKQGQMKV